MNKGIFLAASVIGLSFAGPKTVTAQHVSSSAETDRAAIETIVESVGNLADRGEFAALQRIFADRLRLDYSSLTGQPAAQMTSAQLMAAWSGVLPGFDRTRHKVSRIKVMLNGDRATAQARIVADHWLRKQHWQVTGTYSYKLARQKGQWKVTAMTFTLQGEKGSRAIFRPAMQAAAAKILPGKARLVGDRNKKTVRAFFNAIERGDVPAAIRLFADDGVQVNPYHNNLLPKGAKGKAALLAYWTPVPTQFASISFRIDRLLATEDPNVVFVAYRGDIGLKNGGRYRNNYYSIFRFNHAGRITEYVEIFDPIVAARGFGLLKKIK